MTKIKKTFYYSYKLNTLAKGCQLCVQGRKSVFFITGVCPESCFFCPISEKKKNKDVIYMNELPTRNLKDILREIRLCQSKGVGITGGDPLARFERTVHYIKKLKKVFGKKFHIHLYTPLTLVTESKLKKLYKAGLDEIRFHLDLENKKFWNKILLAKKFNWKIGIEIPVIPNKEQNIKQLIDFLIALKIDFLNLNQLEYSDTNAQSLAKKGFKTINSLSYAINGSEELAKKLLKYIEKNYPSMNVHYCTAKLKDNVQLRKRIFLRASSIKKSYEKLTKDGTLLRGTIYLNEFLPSFNYREKLKNISTKKKKLLIKKLECLKRILKKEFKISHLCLDVQKLRLLTSIKAIENLSKVIAPKKFKLAIVEEYPTYDGFEVEVKYL